KLHDFPTVAMNAADQRTVWHLLGPGGRQYEFEHHPVLVADDLLTLKFSVLQGTGMSILPDYIGFEEFRRKELISGLAGWSARPGIVMAVFASRRGMVPAVRHFMDFLGENVVGERAVPPSQ